MMERKDGRACNAPRAHRFIPNFVSTAAGSCLIETGGTRVICTASVEEGVPPFLRGKGCGWLTAGGCLGSRCRVGSRRPGMSRQRSSRLGLSRGAHLGKTCGLIAVSDKVCREEPQVDGLTLVARLLLSRRFRLAGLPYLPTL